MKSPPIEQKEQIRKRKRIIPLLFVFLQLQVVIFAISWFPINLINLLADCLHLGDSFSMYIMIIFLVVALVVKPMWLFQSNAFQNAKLKRTCTCIHVSSIFSSWLQPVVVFSLLWNDICPYIPLRGVLVPRYFFYRYICPLTGCSWHAWDKCLFKIKKSNDFVLCNKKLSQNKHLMFSPNWSFWKFSKRGKMV